MLISVLFALVHGFASITQRGNQIVSGVAINFLAAGLTAFLGQAWFGEGGRTPQLQNDRALHLDQAARCDGARDVPILGPIYSEVISGHNLLVYVAFLAVPFTAWVVYPHTLRAPAEGGRREPAAVDTAGISVTWLRYRAVMITACSAGSPAPISPSRNRPASAAT